MVHSSSKNLAASAVLLGLALLPITACKPKPTAAISADAPAGEVWITSQQAAGMKLKVETVEEKSVDDTIVSSGRIAFDDTRVAHIFSPVTGRVTSIQGQ